jgi:nucleotide-binding universal stress UspA family protein
MLNLKLTAMEEKLITIVTLPYSTAYILKMQLEAENIPCDLENINLIEGAASSTVRVKIMENDIQKAIPILEEMLGVKPFIEETQTEKKERHILVPVDFSVHSEKACKMAVNIAGRLHTKLILMHCYINPVIHSIPFSDIYAYDSSLLAKMEYSEENANKEFQKFVNKISKEVGNEKWKSVSPEYIIKSGYPDDDILAFAQKYRSQLIVMGSGGSNVPYGTLGSIAADIMYNATVPVLIVPEETSEQTLSNFSNVLYATNFDEKDFASLDKLMLLLKPFNIKLKCVHVGQPHGDGWDMARLEGMKDVLHEKYKGFEFGCHLIVGRDTLESLEKYIKEEKVDIISLTTHKRNMITRLFNPSLAKRMIFHTHTPLLVFQG